MKSMFIVLSLLISFAAYAETTYSRSTPCILYALPGEGEIATIEADASMTVLDTVGAFLKVTVTGYIPINASTSPAVVQPKKATVSQSKPSTSYSGRCQATTKKGAQCKRNAAKGSNYCWQHGG